MTLSIEECASMKWEDLVKLGVDKSIQHNITLSVFKEVTKDIFPESDFENEDWDEEDFWTHRFENWRKQIDISNYRTVKQIEALIKEETDDLIAKNNLLMSRILNWYSKTRDESFAEHMGIMKDNYGG